MDNQITSSEEVEAPVPAQTGGGGRDLEAQGEHPRPRGPGDGSPGISWGPGKNFFGWAMTLVLLALIGGIGFAGFKLFGETVGEAGSLASDEERKRLEKQVRTLGADLCAASLQAGTAPPAAAQLFGQKVHGPLHALAGALAEEDRPAATKLLRDKFNVEEDIRRQAPPPELAASFAALNESTMDGLRILSLPSPACLPPAAPPAPPPPPPPAPPA